MNQRLVVWLIACGLSTPAAAQQWSVNAPIPTNLQSRIYLDPAIAAVYQDKLERVVGYWGVLDGTKLIVTSARPASLSGQSSAPVKVVLQDTKPTYRSVIDNSTALRAAIPVISVSWESSKKGSVTVTDAAQFLVNADPSDADWRALGAAVGAKRWVFVDAALLSLVETEVLTKKTGSANALLSALNIGGDRWEAQSGATTSFVVSLTYKERPCAIMGNCLSTSLSNSGLGIGAEASQEGESGGSEAEASLAGSDVLEIAFDTRAPADVMASSN